jgi:hypothetical protein
LIEWRTFDIADAAALPHSCGDATSGDSRCEQAQRLTYVVADVRDHSEIGRGPQNTDKPGEGGIVELEEAFYSLLRGKDRSEQARRVGLFTRRRQQALKKSTDDLI